MGQMGSMGMGRGPADIDEPEVAVDPVPEVAVDPVVDAASAEGDPHLTATGSLEEKDLVADDLSFIAEDEFDEFDEFDEVAGMGMGMGQMGSMGMGSMGMGSMGMGSMGMGQMGSMGMGRGPADIDEPEVAVDPVPEVAVDPVDDDASAVGDPHLIATGSLEERDLVADDLSQESTKPTKKR